MRCAVLVLCASLPGPLFADVVYAARTIRPDEVIQSQDVALQPGTVPGTYDALVDVVGQEARIALYAGRPIRRGDVQPPAIVRRNAIVEIVFMASGLEIVTEGRALARAGVGDVIHVLNAGSRARVTGTVLADGRILVE